MSVERPLILLLGFAFAGAFACFWLLVIWIIARIGGWATLAKGYQTHSRPDGVCYSWRSLRIIPFTNYNGCINVTLSREGVYMIPFILFRFAHSALLIPWVHVKPPQEVRFIFRLCFLSIHASGKTLDLYLPGSAREWINQNIAPRA